MRHDEGVLSIAFTEMQESERCSPGKEVAAECQAERAPSLARSRASLPVFQDSSVANGYITQLAQMGGVSWK